jgi:hypothetical protein
MEKISIWYVICPQVCICSGRRCCCWSGASRDVQLCPFYFLQKDLRGTRFFWYLENNPAYKWKPVGGLSNTSKLRLVTSYYGMIHQVVTTNYWPAVWFETAWIGAGWTNDPNFNGCPGQAATTWEVCVNHLEVSADPCRRPLLYIDVML